MTFFMIHLSGSHLLRQSKPRHCLLVISRDCKNTLWHSECAFEKSYKKVQYWHKIYWVLMSSWLQNTQKIVHQFLHFFITYFKSTFTMRKVFFAITWNDQTIDIYTLLYYTFSTKWENEQYSHVSIRSTYL